MNFTVWFPTFQAHHCFTLHRSDIYSAGDFCFSSVDMIWNSAHIMKKCQLILMEVATILCSKRAVRCTQNTSCKQTPRQFYHSKRIYHFACRLDEESGSLAVIIIPCLLALSTVSVVALILYSLHKNKERMQSTAAPSTHGINSKICVSTKNQELTLFCVWGQCQVLI